MKKLVCIHGPNLDLLGSREQEYYGIQTLAEVNRRIKSAADQLKFDIEILQSNCEQTIIQSIRDASDHAHGLIINPAGLGYKSLVLRDALIMCQIPVIEVHLSNIHAREVFRQKTIISDVCLGQITGLNWMSYVAALHAFRLLFDESVQTSL